ncbi:SH2 domain-containing protein 2A [Trichinella pseudospiralis]
MNNLKNINEEDNVRWNYDKDVEDTSLLLRIQSKQEKPVAIVKPMLKNQPTEMEVVDELTEDEYLLLATCRSTVNNRMRLREFYRKQLANESYFHGYLTEKDASEILKDQPNGCFLVHTTNERGVLNPVMLAVTHYGKVVHHALNVGILGKCFGKTRGRHCTGIICEGIVWVLY